MSDNKVLSWGGQAVLYGLFAGFVGVFSTWPSYRHLGDDEALLRLSFRHAGAIATDCRSRTPEELAKLPPQLRAQLDCGRERSPVRVKVELDGRPLIDETFAPAGLRRDGAAAGYRRLPIAAGDHRIRVEVNDDVRVQGFNHSGERSLAVRAGQVVLIDFIADQGGVVIR